MRSGNLAASESSRGHRLWGRAAELETLQQLLRDLREGRSRVLILLGEAGVGKTVLLDELAQHSESMTVLRATGVEQETEIAYAALHQLCAPILEYRERLPAPQREAVAVALGLEAGPVPAALLIGLGVLGLLAEAAQKQPVVCIVDDGQWLDPMSGVILAFVARRLDAESVGFVCAVRSPRTNEAFRNLPELELSGLDDAEALAMLTSAFPGSVTESSRASVIAEARGNPLALLEYSLTLSATEVTFGPGDRRPSQASHRVEAGFTQRVTALPFPTRLLLTLAAVEPTGDVPLLWRAAAALGLRPDDAIPAEAASLVELEHGLAFTHPLVRSEVWRSADAADLRKVHAALADATNPDLDPDRKAWHHAHAAVGPDETVAAELERTATRAAGRGGKVAAAAFLRRAADLSLDAAVRARRMLAAAEAQLASGAAELVPELLAEAERESLGAAQRATVERLRAKTIPLLTSSRDSGPLLLASAARLDAIDRVAATDTYLSAFAAALDSGRLDSKSWQAVVAAARSRPSGDAQGPGGDLLDALLAWSAEAFPDAAPALQRALESVPAEPSIVVARLATAVAFELWDLDAVGIVSSNMLRAARASGVLSSLMSALQLRAEYSIHRGDLASAEELVDELAGFSRAAGLPVDATATLLLKAYRGSLESGVDAVDALAHESAQRGEQRLSGYVAYARAVLGCSIGDYAAAAEAAAGLIADAGVGIAGLALIELVEAAGRIGDVSVAVAARDQLRACTSALTSGWATGVHALADALVLSAEAHADGNADDESIEAKYQLAVDKISAAGAAASAARATLLYGEWLRRRNRRVDARKQLRAAHEWFAQAGMAALGDRAARELAATGEIVRKRLSLDLPELTPQESQIVRHAIAGRTNPEIAATLFLSHRTVEWHLRKVFGKLGITSRRDLARVMGSGRPSQTPSV